MYNVKQVGPLYVVYDDATSATIKECQSASEAAAYAATEKAGDVGNLAKHMLKKYGDEHLFTACMSDEATQEYEHDARAAVCARVHHEATGKWPTQKEMKEMDETEKADAGTNELPDSAFLHVEAGGEKDDGGKTVPRTLRHLPYKKADGSVDLPRLRNALSRLGQTDTGKVGGEKWLTEPLRESLQKKAQKVLADNTDAESAKKESRPNILEQVMMALKGDSDKRKNGDGLPTMQETAEAIKEGRRNSATDAERLQTIHDLSVENGAACMVTKDASGKSRWTLISTNAYEDRDGEIVSRKAIKADVARMKETGQYGPLRLWHLGYPDVEKKEAGPGVDIGDCDYSEHFGKFNVESGTFRNERIAAAIKERADRWGVSKGFFHPPDQPDREGVYHEIYTFERSLLPKQKASNSLTPLASIIKESEMTTKDEKIKQLNDLLGEDVAGQVLKAVDKAEKDATERGLTYKQQKDTSAKTTEKGDKKDGKDEPDEDDMDGMDEATAKAYKAMLPHIVKTIHALTKKANIEDSAEREAKAEKKEAKRLKLKEERKELKAHLKELEKQVAELSGDQPRLLTQGFRASQSEQTILNGALKEVTQQADPLGDFMKALGMAQTK